MTRPSPPCCPREQPRVPTAAVSGFGCLGAITVGHLASRIWPPQTFHAWLLVLAIFVGVFAAKVADHTAVVVTTAAATLVFVSLRIHTGAGVEAALVTDVVGYGIPVGFAAILGRGQRWMRTDREYSDDHDGTVPLTTSIGPGAGSARNGSPRSGRSLRQQSAGSTRPRSRPTAHARDDRRHRLAVRLRTVRQRRVGHAPGDRDRRLPPTVIEGERVVHGVRHVDAVGRGRADPARRSVGGPVWHRSR